MDESVITGNIRRNVENFCHEELLTLNRGMAYLLGRPEIDTEANPLGPTVIVESFATALRGVRAEERVKLAILRELNQSSLGDLNSIYADVNTHLINLRVVPAAGSFLPPRSSRSRARKASSSANDPGPEIDLLALFRKRHGDAGVGAHPRSPQAAYPTGAAGPQGGGYGAGAPQGGYPTGAAGPQGGGYGAGAPQGGFPTGAAGPQGGGYGAGAPQSGYAPGAGAAPASAAAMGPNTLPPSF